VPDVAALPAGVVTEARAAILGRLWGAFAREPIPGLRSRRVLTDPVWGDQLVVEFDGRVVSGPRAAAEPFAEPPRSLSLDGEAHSDPAALLHGLGLPERFRDEIENCVGNLALARSTQPAPDGGEPTLARAMRAPDPLAYLEQCVVDGHPLHPCCRTRTNLSPVEVLAYAPEHRPVVDLVRVRVPEDRWIGLNAEPELLVHPWQRDHVLGGYAGLTEVGTVPARPLMSLRSLALVDDPAGHVKTAVDVQMTSAVRIVSPAAIHNGPAVSALLGRLRPAGLRVIAEVATGAVLVDGEPCRSLAMVRRRVPLLPPGTLAVPFGVLGAPSVANGQPILVELVGDRDPLKVLTAVARVVLTPVLALLRLGVALEAHGQNLLLVIHRGRPAGVLYRDMGGVRISPTRLRRHGHEAPPLHGDIESDDPAVLRVKLFAAAISTVLAELVSIAQREFGLATARSWAAIAAVARRCEADPDDLRALLHEPLPLKAMTAMRLAADPLDDQWVTLPNPMEATG
jgi:siderophore synthetase component